MPQRLARAARSIWERTAALPLAFDAPVLETVQAPPQAVRRRCCPTMDFAVNPPCSAPA